MRDVHHPLNKLKKEEAPVRVKHIGQEFMPIKRLFRSVLIRNDRSACGKVSRLRRMVPGGSRANRTLLPVAQTGVAMSPRTAGFPQNAASDSAASASLTCSTIAVS